MEAIMEEYQQVLVGAGAKLIANLMKRTKKRLNQKSRSSLSHRMSKT